MSGYGDLTNKVTTLKVEPVQLIAGLLRIHYILVDHKRCALCIVGDTLSDLAVWNINISLYCIVIVKRPTVSDRTCRRDRRVPRELRCSWNIVLALLTVCLLLTDIFGSIDSCQGCWQTWGSWRTKLYCAYINDARIWRMMGRGISRTYRLTSGASLPPRLIAWLRCICICLL